MAPGANNRNTGTVPKQIKTRNNNVEMVVPTRRDLQQFNVRYFLFNVFFLFITNHDIANKTDVERNVFSHF